MVLLSGKMGIIKAFLRFFGFQHYDDSAIIDYAGYRQPPAEQELIEYKRLDEAGRSLQPTTPQKEVKLSIVRPELSRHGKVTYSLSVYTESLKEGYVLLVDVSRVLTQSREEARRIVNFLSGVTEALGGTKREVVRDLYLFAPPGVSVHGGQEYDES